MLFTLPTYGCFSKARGGKLGYNVISGSNHGLGGSICVSKINLESPLKRKIIGNQKVGVRQVAFGHIQCKKDVTPILSLVAKKTNEGIKKLKEGMLVVVMNDTYHTVRAVIIPKQAHTYIVELVGETLVLQYKTDEKTYSLPIPCGIPKDGPYHIWTDIPLLSCSVTGYLALYATVMGKDDCSGCRYP